MLACVSKLLQSADSSRYLLELLATGVIERPVSHVFYPKHGAAATVSVCNLHAVAVTLA